jgi:hypothetical protein
VPGAYSSASSIQVSYDIDKPVSNQEAERSTSELKRAAVCVELETHSVGPLR